MRFLGKGFWEEQGLPGRKEGLAWNKIQLGIKVFWGGLTFCSSEGGHGGGVDGWMVDRGRVDGGCVVEKWGFCEL